MTPAPGPRRKGRRRRDGGGPPSARRVALEVFLAWDSSQESLDILLGPALDSARLEGRDRDLAAELVRGVFRWRGRLDWQLEHLARRPVADLDVPVRWILRLGLHQIENLDRIPVHAAVDTAVELAKRHGHAGTASLVNAVLRRASTDLGALEPPDPAEDPVRHLEVRTSHPRWLLERWLERHGFAHTLARAAAGNRKPSLTLRITSPKVDAAELLETLRKEGAEAEPGSYLADCVRLPGGWHPTVRQWLESGDAVVQDEAAGLVAHVARPMRGARVLDVCAAPGGKTVHLAGLCGEAMVVAADRSLRRSRRVAEVVRRLDLEGIHPVVADGAAPATRGGFTRVLVDAPCTNTGVLARRPDARWRRTPADVARLAALQGKLLDAARGQVAPEGLLVYSTCSLEPEENEDVIAAYLERHPDDSLLPAEEVVPDELVSGAFLAVDPAVHGADGAFAAALRPAAPEGPAR